jgi:hypothetical protein
MSYDHHTLAVNQASPGLTPSDADALWAQFLAAPAVMTCDDLDTVTRDTFGPDAVRTLRCSLVMLTRSGLDLVEMMHKDGEIAPIFRELTECATARAAALREVADLLDMAAVRLKLALCDDAGTACTTNEGGRA